MKERVLVVDDYEDSAETVCLLLEALGYEARSCHCGRDALALINELHPDIVLLDVCLWDLSGYEVVRAVRSRPNGEAIHVVALTGLGRREDRERAIQAGFDQHAIKPIDLRCLTEIMARARTQLHT